MVRMRSGWKPAGLSASEPAVCLSAIAASCQCQSMLPWILWLLAKAGSSPLQSVATALQRAAVAGPSVPRRCLPAPQSALRGVAWPLGSSE